MITSISELFVLVPEGFGSKFIKAYANTEKYKSKIAFLEDTKEIWTNGKAFGLNAAADVAKLKEELTALQGTTSLSIQNAIDKEVEDRNAAIEELKNSILSEDLSGTFESLKEIEEWLQNHGIQAANLMESVAKLTDDVSIINGDSSVEGSILNVVAKALETANAELTNYVDSSILALDEKIEANTASINSLNTEVSNNTQSIINEEARAQAQEEHLETLINEVASVNVWEAFEIDQDMPAITDDTIVAYTLDDIISEAETNSSEKDVIVTSDESMAYFSNSDAATFKNITI